MNNSYPTFGNQRDQLWWEIQDIIAPAAIWPENMKLFWTKNLNHEERHRICAFVIYNGLNPEVKNKYFNNMNYLFHKISTTNNIM